MALDHVGSRNTRDRFRRNGSAALLRLLRWRNEVPDRDRNKSSNRFPHPTKPASIIVIDRAPTHKWKVGRQSFKQLNRAIMQVETNWLNPDGIPGRPWFKHTLYAARYTYAHLELPGLTEAIERGDWKAAIEQGKILEAALTKNSVLLGTVRAELGK